MILRSRSRDGRKDQFTPDGTVGSKDRQVLHQTFWDASIIGKLLLDDIVWVPNPTWFYYVPFSLILKSYAPFPFLYKNNVPFPLVMSLIQWQVATKMRWTMVQRTIIITLVGTILNLDLHVWSITWAWKKYIISATQGVPQVKCYFNLCPKGYIHITKNSSVVSNYPYRFCCAQRHAFS